MGDVPMGRPPTAGASLACHLARSDSPWASLQELDPLTTYASPTTGVERELPPRGLVVALLVAEVAVVAVVAAAAAAVVEARTRPSPASPAPEVQLRVEARCPRTVANQISKRSASAQQG
jgi:hypothetical protein